MLIKEIYLTAIHAAIEASKEIMRIYNGVIDLDYKEDGSPLTNADLSSSKIINDYLSPLGFPITSEETIHTKYKERSSWENCWCVDPLDGTKEFVSKNGEFAVNIAFIEGAYPVFGLIASPVYEEILFAMPFGYNLFIVQLPTSCFSCCSVCGTRSTAKPCIGLFSC